MPDPIRAACRRDYFPAFHHSGSRALHELLWLVLHDEEAPTAKAAADYFESRASGGSAHLCLDETVCYRCLGNEQVPWGASSAPVLSANFHGFHIEQAGYARWAPRQWVLHRKTVERAAFKTAQHLRLFGLPLRWVTAAELVHGARTGKPAKGVTTHREITLASKVLDPAHAWRYTHTDPGLFYPRRRFMRLAAGFLAELERVA